MAKIVPPKIRVAGPGLHGAEFHNYYQLVSVLLSLYVKATDRHDDEDYSGVWDTCSSSVLNQLGVAHQCLTKALSQPAADKITAEKNELVKRTQTIVKRLLVIEDQLTEWVPVSRWTRVFLNVEKSLTKLGRGIAAQNTALEPLLAQNLNAHESRCALLLQVMGKARREEDVINQNYALPVAL